MRGLDGKLCHMQKAASKRHEVEGALLNAVGASSSVSVLREDQNAGLFRAPCIVFATTLPLLFQILADSQLRLQYRWQALC